VDLKRMLIPLLLDKVSADPPLHTVLAPSFPSFASVKIDVLF
jgi:hypothetical protein